MTQSLEGGLRTLVSSILDPELRRNEQLVTRHTASRERPAHRLLVHVGSCGVEEPVAGLGCVQNGPLAHGRVRHLKDAEPGHGHVDTVVECHVLHGSLPVCTRGGPGVFPAGAGPSEFGSARRVLLALPGLSLNPGAPHRLQRCRSSSSASSHRTRAWPQRNQDRLSLRSERSA
jgi:hypothetical protein